jgi:hypothetical protein
MAAFEQTGLVGNGIVGATPLTPNIGVVFTASRLVACGAGDKAVGIVKDAYAAGLNAPFTRCSRTCQYVMGSGTLAAGDFVKWTTGGLVIADTTSGATALSVNSVGKCRTDVDASTGVWVDFF